MEQYTTDAEPGRKNRVTADMKEGQSVDGVDGHARCWCAVGKDEPNIGDCEQAA